MPCARVKRAFFFMMRMSPSGPVPGRDPPHFYRSIARGKFHLNTVAISRRATVTAQPMP